MAGCVCENNVIAVCLRTGDEIGVSDGNEDRKVLQLPGDLRFIDGNFFSVAPSVVPPGGFGASAGKEEVDGKNYENN